MSNVRGDGQEELPQVQGKELWLHFAGAAKRYHMSKLRETQVKANQMTERKTSLNGKIQRGEPPRMQKRLVTFMGEFQEPARGIRPMAKIMRKRPNRQRRKTFFACGSSAPVGFEREDIQQCCKMGFAFKLEKREGIYQLFPVKKISVNTVAKP
ncbi:hypothetical protein MG293_000425 [Ovis ammon polii]|uniref:Uncharacterized protein n=1 Tax=Ovis ammon polii TaxID=230172 RepID=A0AAD4YEJ6_OVIAM|nr:hypothetical protein MG293_000425 [Ovis ammon polii]